MAELVALNFGGLLRQLRVAARLTQEELAEAAQLSPRSVSDLERGVNRTARKDTAELLADALGLAEPVRALFVAAARGHVPAADVLAAVGGQAAPGSGPAWAGCPYLGLVPFGEQDARVFYGRGELAAQLVRRLAGRLDGTGPGTGIVLVAGESGTGKSSLLRAGLMPRLAAGGLGPGSALWPRRVMRPTASPLRELARQLADVAGAEPDSVYRSLSAAPGEAPLLVELAVRTAASRAGPGSGGLAGAAAQPRMVLVVDQFEELFTAGGDADADRVEREAFIAALHAAATGPAGPRKVPPALVVAAVRADFLGRLIAYPPLKAALDAGLFTVGPMSEAELRLAVTGPAAEADLAVEPALAEAVIAELREEEGGSLGGGVLPLMSQAMAATWEHREAGELTLRAYRRAGGVADAVNRSAQAGYDALTGQQQDAARLVFTQLTIITPDGRLARRRCSRTDLQRAGAHTEDIDAVVDAFSAQRLLVLGEDSVEISHDVLFQAWKRLRDWLGDDQLDRALYSQVVTDAHTWDAHDRDSSYLYQPGRLAAIDAATARWQDAPARYPPLPATSHAFLAAAHHAARRSARRRRAVIAGLLALTVIAASAAGIALRDAANASRQHAIALSRQLAAQSLSIDPTDPVTARRLAVAAWRVFPTGQAGSAMTTLLTEQQQHGILPCDPANSGGVRGVAFSPDGKLLASADADGTVRLWDPATEQAVRAPIPVHRGIGFIVVNAVAFSPDGKLLASADADGAVRLWDPATGHAASAALPADPGTRGGVQGVAFSPDGKLLASADADGYVLLWNLATRRPVGVGLPADPGTRGGAYGVAFSPDGKLLASADADGTVQLWDPATRQAFGAPIATNYGAYAVAFSPDGKLLASADAGGTVQLWDPATRQAVGAPIATNTVGYGVAFSPDGKLLAAADADGTVRLWNPASERAPGAPLPADPGPPGGAYGVAFSPDGKLLASADADGTVRLWDPVAGRFVRALTAGTGGLGDPMLGVAFSPDGKQLASVDAYPYVWLWDPASGLPVFSGGLSNGFGTGYGSGVAYSPDGKLLASASADGLVLLWNPATGQQVGDPLVAVPGLGGGLNAVAFSPDGRMLATAHADGLVRFWSPATRRPLGPPLRADPGLGGGVTAVAFSRDGKLLASAGADGTVRLWDPATGQAVGAALPADPGTPGGVTAVAFSPDGKLLASAGADGTVRLWDPATGQAVGAALPADPGTPGGVTAVAFSPDGKLLAGAGADGTILRWPMALIADPYAALCAGAGPPTPADWAQYAPNEPRPRICG